MRAFLVRHWSSLESRDGGPEERQRILERACASLASSHGAPLPAGPALTRLLTLLVAQKPSLPPLVAKSAAAEEEVRSVQPLLDVEFLIAVCDDVLTLLRQARSTQRAALVAELATSGEVLETLHTGMVTLEQLFSYAGLLAELRGAALVRRAQLLDSAMRKYTGDA